MNKVDKELIERVVNSQEAVDIVGGENPFHDNWPRLSGLIQEKLGRQLTEDEDDNLYSDLRDWWKNGNFQVWEEGQDHGLGFVFGPWELGDLDFWEAENEK
jgi:hypothetical protein